MELGIDNPLEWMNNQTDELIDFWYAYYKVEPWGDRWYMAALMWQKLTEILAYLGSSIGIKCKARSWRVFMPNDYFAKTEPKEEKKMQLLTGNDAFAMLSGRFR